MPSEINGALVTLLLTIVALWLRLVKTLLDSRMEPSGRRSCYYLDRGPLFDAKRTYHRRV